eukprot:Hpha_TRINITY_DN12922_c0_g2::TRINITY_DN12922_c0_g2_i1::g.164400::m.164400
MATPYRTLSPSPQLQSPGPHLYPHPGSLAAARSRLSPPRPSKLDSRPSSTAPGVDGDDGDWTAPLALWAVRARGKLDVTPSRSRYMSPVPKTPLPPSPAPPAPPTPPRQHFAARILEASGSLVEEEEQCRCQLTAAAEVSRFSIYHVGGVSLAHDDSQLSSAFRAASALLTSFSESSPRKLRLASDVQRSELQAEELQRGKEEAKARAAKLDAKVRQLESEAEARGRESSEKLREAEQLREAERVKEAESRLVADKLQAADLAAARDAAEVLREEVRVLKAAVGERDKQLEQAQATAESLRIKAGELEIAVADTSEELTLKRTASAELQSGLEQQGKELVQAKAALEELSAEVERKEKSASEAASKEVKDELEKERRRVAELQSQLQQQKSVADEAAQELEKERDRVAELQS